MSLKFGIYLVEQRIISPEQFCGLVKIQQEATKSLATLAIRKNLMTIKQVTTVLDGIETNPQKSFVKTAMERDLIDRDDADQLLHHQQVSCPSVRRLVVECGLLTQRQTSVLFLHFERNGTNAIKPQAPAQPKPVSSKPKAKVGPRQPKFRQRPVVVRQLSQQ